MAARPRTLPAAVAPVLVGTALAGQAGVFHPLTFIATLVGAIFIQVGTNLSNDYSDARRGADTEDRLGPVRVTAGGLVPPRQVLMATWVSFGVAVLVGIYLVAVASWELLLVGGASILAAVQDPFIDAAARNLSGIPMSRAFGGILHTFSGATREQAARAGLGLDDFIHIIGSQARYAGEMGGA